MADNDGFGRSVEVFVRRRREWIDDVVSGLSGSCEEFGPRLCTLLPDDLGDRRLVQALTLTRIAAADAEVRPAPEIVADLERLLQLGGRGRAALSDALGEARAGVRGGQEPALRSWEAGKWEQLLLAEWLRERTASVGPVRAEAELGLRWGVRDPLQIVAGDVERSVGEHGLCGLPDYFAAAGDEPARLLLDAYLGQAHVIDRVREHMMQVEEMLDDAGHLFLLEEQRACTAGFRGWCAEQKRSAAPATKAFLEHLETAVDTYRQKVLEPVVGLLSPVERAMMRTARAGRMPDDEAYLAEFLYATAADEPSDEPSEECEEDRAAAGGPGPLQVSAALAARAREQTERGELSWRGVRGTLPVWFHVVTSPQERAAALAFSGAALRPVVHIEPAAPDWGGSQSLFDQFDAPDDWYPEPGIRLRYEQGSARDMCELLVLARLGHARLDFLVPGPSGTFTHLRSVRARVRPDHADWWTDFAVGSLRALAPVPEDLPEILAEQYDEEDRADDEHEAEEPEERGRPDDGSTDGAGAGDEDAPGAAPVRQESLPPELLAKVRALLRQAEDPAATEQEAELFREKATELMAKYGIEQAMLHAERPETDRLTDRLVEVADPWARQSQLLLGTIAFALRCQAVTLDRRDRQAGRVRRRVHLFGYASDLRRADVLYTSLRLQMLSGADRANALHRPPGESVKAYKRSWMYGFIREVVNRIKEVERAVQGDAERRFSDDGPHDGQQSGRSVALVLFDRRKAVEARVSVEYPKLRKAGKIRFQGSGYRQGRIDGQQADIGGPSVEHGDPLSELEF
ncbi:DUF2786 domain-containing protein [Streptomyces sp. HB2AG]|uniref:DUF2786 domain-containing protein n=1 Tax=Streptomyces sp. HB2AG TaxID=2983400 RepID=UPI0022AA33CB|nr:DUF2786 domain-containing protein [Streptomyces sp. HB2AG]MCZ2526212.1 DUF2786 domain-containing protein [Streptomyces sp. HB2AG]